MVDKFSYTSKFDVCKLEIKDSIVFMLTPLNNTSLPFMYVTFDKLPSVTSDVVNVPNSFENDVRLEILYAYIFPKTDKFPSRYMSPIKVFPTYRFPSSDISPIKLFPTYNVFEIHMFPNTFEFPRMFPVNEFAKIFPFTYNLLPVVVDELPIATFDNKYISCPEFDH
jgi:hypothetical protein